MLPFTFVEKEAIDVALSGDDIRKKEKLGILPYLIQAADVVNIRHLCQHFWNFE
jgi:hypothetical protein